MALQSWRAVTGIESMAIAPKQLVVLGDSGVHGWGDREQGGWCERLRLDWMRTPKGPVVYGLGVRGDGLERVAARWEQEWTCRGELRRKTPDGVILSIGLNDSARVGRPDGRPQLNLDGYSFGMGQLLDETDPDLFWFMTPLMNMMPLQNCPHTNQEVAISASGGHQSRRPEPFSTAMRTVGVAQLTNRMGSIQCQTSLHQQLVQWNALLGWAGLEPLANVCVS